MSLLSSLKLTNAVAPAGGVSSDPLKWQRTRLCDALSIQRELAVALREGKAARVMRKQRVAKEGGGTEVKEVVVNARPWYWHDSAGVYFFEVRYGNKRLPLSKDAPVVEIGKDVSQVAVVVETIFKAAVAGELDDLLRAVVKTKDK